MSHQTYLYLNQYNLHILIKDKRIHSIHRLGKQYNHIIKIKYTSINYI